MELHVTQFAQNDGIMDLWWFGTSPIWTGLERGKSEEWTLQSEVYMGTRGTIQFLCNQFNELIKTVTLDYTCLWLDHVDTGISPCIWP